VTTCGTVSYGTASASVNNVTKEVCVTYTPTAGYVGLDYACYIICDTGTPSKCDTLNIFFNVTPTNLAPLVINDITNTMTTNPVSGNVLMNDSDPENQVLTVNTTPVSGPNHGTIVLNTNGTFIYTPIGNFIGTDTMRYQVCDNGTPQLCASGLLVIEIRAETTGGNQKPVANDDNTMTPSGTPITVNVKANDFDPQGGSVGNPTLIGTPIGGTAVVNPDGTVSFIPSPTFMGAAYVQYQICDNGTPALCDTATLNIQVYPNPNMPNVAPIAVNDNATTTNTQQLSSDVATNDSDPNVGQTMAFSLVTNVLNGNVTLLPTGAYTYRANSGYIGRDSFRYKICDDGTPSLCDTAWAFIDVTNPVVVAANLSPVASPDNPTVIAGTSTSINVKANDYEPNGQPMDNPTITTPSPNGTLSVNADGTILFTPDSGFTGSTSFIYQICDNGTPALCDTALVTVIVAPAVSLVNRAPVAQDDIFSAAMNNSISNAVTSNDSDVDAGQTLTYTQLTLPTQGFLVSFNVNGTFNYTPLANFAGIDSFKYKVCDSASPSMCDTATVYLNLVNNPTNANLAPIATDDVASTTVGVSTTINVKSNDIDPNDTPLTNNPTIVGTPVGGTTTVNPDGTITFTPNSGFTGTASFVYFICDSGSPALCDEATVVVSVFNTTPFVNIAPIAQNDATTTPVNTPVSGNVALNDSELNTGQALTYTVSINPTQGSMSFNSNGAFTYTPQTSFTGRDSFRYQVCDNGSPIQCSTAWVYIDVTPNGTNINAAPVVNDDAFSTFTGIALTINVKANDYDVNADQVLSHPTLIETPIGGTVIINTNGTVTFTPNSGFIGQASFRYALCDNGSPMLCDTAYVTIDVQPMPTLTNSNLAPVAVDDAGTTMKNMPFNSNVATNDNDPNGGQILTYSLLINPTHGVASLNGNGTYTFTPTTNYVGSDRFVYVVCDNGTPSKCDTAQVLLTIFNDPCVTLNLKVLLEGPYSVTSGKMRTTLNSRGLLPGQTPVSQFAVATPSGQPFAGAPWSYTGNESVTTYAPSVVDWVLVSLRTNDLTASSMLKAAALLHEDGRLEFLNPCMTLPNGAYYIVIEHRNHMGVMSPTTVSVQNGEITYDFTTAESYFLDNPPSFGQKLLGGKWVMYAGDGKKNTQTTNFDINYNDSQLWKGESGIFDQYRYGDFNMDADVNFQDQVLWKSNNGKYSGVPH
jgi:lipopolysaccharide export system protein LptA